MKEQDLMGLETRVKELRQGLADVADDTDFEEFWRIFHSPGWTTLAELAFVAVILDTMQQQVQALASLKEGLLTGSRAVGVTQESAVR